MALHVRKLLARGAPARSTNKIQHFTLPTLEDCCFYYIIRHLSEFPPVTLCLLPVTIRKILLLNLPVIDIWRLEADGVTEGLDEENLWKSLINERCQDVSRKHFRVPFYHKMPSRDLYFMFVWDHIFQQPSLYDNTQSNLLYGVPCVLGVEGCTLSELDYQQIQYKLSHVVKNDPDVVQVHSDSNLIPKREFIATLRYFGEVCRIRPKHICFHCMSVGKRILWILDMEQSSRLSILQSFMANLEAIQFNGRGPLANLEKFQDEIQHELFKSFFICIPKLFLGATVANSQCKLKSIEIDADDSQRASGLLASVQSVLSGGYSKVEAFSVKFHHVYSRGSHLGHSLTFSVLSNTTQLINAQPLLRSLDISFPEKIPFTGDNVEIRRRYSEFIATVEKYVQRPHFECLTLRNVLTCETAQQIICSFLSLPSQPHVQLLDLRALNDITFQSDTIIEDPGKSLMISGTVSDDSLTPAVFQMLCNAGVHMFEVVDNVNGIVSALKLPVESLQVKSLCLTICTPPRSQYRRSGHRGRHLTAYRRSFPQGFNMDIPHVGVLQAVEFAEIPRVELLISNPSLFALRIRFQSAKDYVSSSQASNFLFTISDALQSSSCSLRLLALPKLDYPLGKDDKLKLFFQCVFSLPHVEEFELNLAFVEFSLQGAEMIHSCHRENGGKRLAQLSLHCDSISGSGHESLRALLNYTCKDLVL